MSTDPNEQVALDIAEAKKVIAEQLTQLMAENKVPDKFRAGVQTALQKAADLAEKTSDLNVVHHTTSEKTSEFNAPMFQEKKQETNQQTAVIEPVQGIKLDNQ